MIDSLTRGYRSDGLHPSSLTASGVMAFGFGILILLLGYRSKKREFTSHTDVLFRRISITSGRVGQPDTPIKGVRVRVLEY
jgi:hypothetical protein